jgi:hypothetical protein
VVLTDLKILEFLSSQRFHATRMTKGSKALRLILDTRFQDRSHQSTNLSSVPDANCCKPQRLRSLNHTSRLKTHHVSKWLMVPETCKHRAQDRRPTGRDGDGERRPTPALQHQPNKESAGVGRSCFPKLLLAPATEDCP